MWILLEVRWDQEHAGSLVVSTPQKIAGSVAGEREGKGGEEKGGKIGLRPFFFFFNVFASHEDSAKLARGWHGTAHPSKRLGWAVQVEYVSGLWKFEVWKFENSENALVRRFFP